MYVYLTLKNPSTENFQIDDFGFTSKILFRDEHSHNILRMKADLVWVLGFPIFKN